NTLVRLNEFGTCPANRFLFSQLMGISGGEGKFIRFGTQYSRTSVRTPNCARGFQQAEVSPNCRNRSIYLPGNLFQRSKLNLLQVFADSKLTRFRLHLDISCQNLKDFARYLLTNIPISVTKMEVYGNGQPIAA